MARYAVSVLLPVRDAAATLADSLASLARQRFGDFEVVAVNDGSIDGSGAILDSWAERDPRFRVVHLSPTGLVGALNVGLALCRAPFVARHDGDDIAHPARLGLQIDHLRCNPDVAVVSCLVHHFPRASVGTGNRLYEMWLNGLKGHDEILRERFVESPLAHPSVMFRRKTVTGLGGYRDVGWAEDYDLWLRLAESGARFAKLDRMLVFWREHDRRLTRRDGRYSIANFLRCKAHFLARGPLAGDVPVVLWGAGPTGRRLSRCLRAEGVRIRAVVEIDRRRVGSTLHGAPIIAVDDLEGLLPARVVTGVASRGAREEIRKQLTGRGLIEGRDFWCAA